MCLKNCAMSYEESAWKKLPVQAVEMRESGPANGPGAHPRGA